MLNFDSMVELQESLGQEAFKDHLVKLLSDGTITELDLLKSAVEGMDRVTSLLEDFQVELEAELLKKEAGVGDSDC